MTTPTPFIPTASLGCSTYSQCYAACMKLSNTTRELKDERDKTTGLSEVIDEMAAKLQVNQSSTDFKRDIVTIVKLQEREFIQRRANDHLESENGRLRALLLKHKIDFASNETTRTEDVPIAACIAGFFG